MQSAPPVRKHDNLPPPHNEGSDAQLLSLRPRALWHAFRQEHFGFAFLCLYLLSLYLKPWDAHHWLAVLHMERAAIVIVIIGFLLDRQYKIERSALNWLITLFLLQCLASAILAFNVSYAFSYMDIIAEYVVIYFLITGILNSEQRLFLFVLVYFLVNFKLSNFGFFSWLHRGFHFAKYGITGAGWYRNSGELGMEMAMFFDFVLCFALVLRKYWSKWTRRFIYFVALTAAACVIASSSRGAVIALAASLLFLFLMRKSRFKALAGTAALFLVGYLSIPDRFLARFDLIGTGPTSVTRLYYWGKATLMMNEHPMFGVGYYNWIPYFGAHYFDPQLMWRVEAAHNTFLQLGAELGYVGLLLFVAMIVLSFRMNFQSMRIAKNHGFDFLYSFALGMNVAGISLVVASTFLTAYWLPSYWIQFAFTVSLRNVVRHKVEAAVVTKAPERKSAAATYPCPPALS